MLLLILVACSGCTHVHNGRNNIVKVSLKRNRVLARTLTSKAAVHLQRDELALAEPLLNKAIKADRTYAPAHNNLGLVYFTDFDLFRAALSFQEAMRFNPRSPEPQNNLGLTFEAAGRPQAAIEHYQAAHDLAPTDPQFLGNLLRARLRSDETPDMLREDLRQLLFIERRPDWIEWIEDQLELVTNPYLDRGPAGPDVGAIGSGRNSPAALEPAQRIIYDSGPVTSQPAPMSPYSSDNQYQPNTQTPATNPSPVYGAPGTAVPPAFGPPVGHEPVQPQLQATPQFDPPASTFQPAPSLPNSAPAGSIPLNAVPPGDQWETPIRGLQPQN